MKRTRPLLPRLALVIAAALAPASLHASGGFFEEPLTSLPDFLKLDQRPAKTFLQIVAEPAQPTRDVEAVEVEKEIAGFKDPARPAQVLTRIAS